MFESNGIKEYYIQMGAEMLVKGEKFKTVHDAPITIENPDGQNPQQLSVKFTMENQSLGTSGNYRRFRVDSETGEHYVHTINVKTGYPQQSNVLSSLVLSTGSAMEADAYATALLVMKLEDAKQLLKKIVTLKDLLSALMQMGIFNNILRKDSGRQKKLKDNSNNKILFNDKKLLSSFSWFIAFHVFMF